MLSLKLNRLWIAKQLRNISDQFLMKKKLEKTVMKMRTMSDISEKKTEFNSRNKNENFLQSDYRQKNNNNVSMFYQLLEKKNSHLSKNCKKLYFSFLLTLTFFFIENNCSKMKKKWLNAKSYENQAKDLP